MQAAVKVLSPFSGRVAGAKSVAISTTPMLPLTALRVPALVRRILPIHVQRMGPSGSLVSTSLSIYRMHLDSEDQRTIYITSLVLHRICNALCLVTKQAVIELKRLLLAVIGEA